MSKGYFKFEFQDRFAVTYKACGYLDGNTNKWRVNILDEEGGTDDDLFQAMDFFGKKSFKSRDDLQAYFNSEFDNMTLLKENSRVDPDLHVGNTKFYSIPKHQNADFRYSYKKPENSTYIRILAYIVNHPGCSRNEIIEDIRPELKGFNNQGQYAGMFQSLHHDGYFRITTKGEYFPCKKACDFVREQGLKESIQFGKGSNPPTEKDEEIAEKFCILMDWAITPEDIWQVYDYGNGKATISVTKDMDAAMTDQECSDLDDVYYYDYEKDYIISRESEELAKGTFDDDWYGMSDEEVDDYIEKYGPVPEEPDPANRDMGEMYGNYSGDLKFFESHNKKIKEFGDFDTIQSFGDELDLTDSEVVWIMDWLECKEIISYKDNPKEQAQQKVTRSWFIKALNALKQSDAYGADYKEPEDEDYFTVEVEDNYGSYATINISKSNDGKWHEMLGDHDDDFDFRPRNYMGYLKKADILQWLQGDFARVTVK